ncbi:hypothetical protein FRC03_008948 [Tulasnella sp. 419]|nr:hypothetical protein FRC03_008948 [Tulasnella sp. 419]
MAPKSSTHRANESSARSTRASGSKAATLPDSSPPTLESLLQSNPKAMRALKQARIETNKAKKGKQTAGSNLKKRKRSPSPKKRLSTKRKRQASPEKIEESDEESCDGSELLNEASDNSAIGSGESDNDSEGLLDDDEGSTTQAIKGKGKAVLKPARKGGQPGRPREDLLAVSALVVVPEGAQYFADCKAKKKLGNLKKPNSDQIKHLQSIGLAVQSSVKGDLSICRSWTHRQGSEGIENHFPHLVELLSPRLQDSAHLGSDVLYPLAPQDRSLVLYKLMDGKSLEGRFGSNRAFRERVLYFTPRLPLSQKDYDHLGLLSGSNPRSASNTSGPDSMALPSASGSSKPAVSTTQRKSRRSSQTVLPASNMGEVIVLDSDNEDGDQGLGDLIQHLSQESLNAAGDSKPGLASSLVLAQPKEPSSSSSRPFQFADPLAGYNLQFEDVYQSY